MATIARRVIIVSIEKLIFARSRGASGRLTLMRYKEKEDKIELAEGLSSWRVRDV
jgi:hypothetical protein